MRVTGLRSFALVAGSLAVAASQSAAPLAQRGPAAPPGVVLVSEVRTKLESALTSTGTLLIADYHRIDTHFGPNVRIDAVVVTVNDTGTRVRGLRLSVPDEGRPGKPDSTSYVDIDELPGLASALTSMADLVKGWTGVEDRRATILSFTTAGGLRIEIREAGRVQKAFLSTGLLEPVFTGFEIGDLATLRQACEQGLAVLGTK